MRRLFMALMAVALLAGSSSASIIVIDDFDSPPGPVPLAEYEVGFTLTDPQSGSNVGLPPLQTIGGQRDYVLDYIGGGLAGDKVTANIVGGPLPPQVFSLSNDSEVMSTFKLIYGNASPLAQDFSDQVGVEIYFDDTDLDSEFIVELWDDSSGYDFMVYALPDDFQGIYFVPAADFAMNSPVIDKIAITFGYASVDPNLGPNDEQATYTPSFDMKLDYIQTVAIPEPCSMTLLGLGLAGLVARRRRR